jgi:hypothetical protein
MAAITPVEQSRQWKERRERFFGMVDEVRARNEGTPAAVIEAEVSEALQAVRKARAMRALATNTCPD